jgi:hypothetical protein
MKAVGPDGALQLVLAGDRGAQRRRWAKKTEERKSQTA